MGRELKFRAWYKNKMWMQEDIQEDGWELAALWVKDSPIVFMQFTGLHDKNGREIYENDIIVYRDVSGSGQPREFGPRQVRWFKDTCNFNVTRPSNGAEMEVVGDIYTNPELLAEGTT